MMLKFACSDGLLGSTSVSTGLKDELIQKRVDGGSPFLRFSFPFRLVELIRYSESIRCRCKKLVVDKIFLTLSGCLPAICTYAHFSEEGVRRADCWSGTRKRSQSLDAAEKSRRF